MTFLAEMAYKRSTDQNASTEFDHTREVHGGQGSLSHFQTATSFPCYPMTTLGILVHRLYCAPSMERLAESYLFTSFNQLGAKTFRHVCATLTRNKLFSLL